MAAPTNTFWDQEGHFHTNGLHWEGFPRLLWESLSMFHYTEPPLYDGVEYREERVARCRVKMIIPQHPFRSLWPPIEVEVVGYRLVDTLETAALEAIKLFCNQHPIEVAAYPIGLFPTIDPGNSDWDFRTDHHGHLLGDLAEETVRIVTRFMDVMARQTELLNLLVQAQQNQQHQFRGGRDDRNPPVASYQDFLSTQAPFFSKAECDVPKISNLNNALRCPDRKI
jgi:hypothetical protein